MTQWNKLQLENIIPSPVTGIGNTIDTITSAVKTVLTVQITALKALAALSADVLNAEALIIKGAVATLEAVLEPLTGTAQLHMLVVPFRKQPNYALDPDNWPVTWTDSDVGPPEDPVLAARERVLNEKLRQAAFYNGGNQGFLRTVGESLHDQHDGNRPDYDTANAVLAHTWVVGAPDIIGLMDALLTLEGVFGSSLKSNNLAPRTLIRPPQDLSVRAITAPTGKVGALLRWDGPPAEQLFPEFNDIRMRLHEVAIVRSTDDEVLKASSWTDIFGADQPQVLTDETTERSDVLLSNNSKTQLVLQYRYDGSRCTYLDDSGLERDTDYYYAVAYRYAAEMPPGANVSGANVVDGFSVMDYKLLSSVQTVRFAAAIPESTGGLKPDWVATPSVLSLIPDLQFYVETVKQYVGTLADQALGTNTALQTYVDFLEGELTRYSDLVDTINGKIQKLAGLLKTPATGVYTTTIKLEEGGSQAFLRELAERLLDETDTSAPPFHSGTEFVAGIVLLAGAPNLSQLSAVTTFIELLFGTGGDLETSYEQALNNIEKAIEAPLLDDTEAPAAQVTFDSGMNPVDAADPTADVPSAG